MFFSSFQTFGTMGAGQGGEGLPPFDYATDAPFIQGAWEVNDSATNTYVNPSHDFSPSDVNAANNTIDFGTNINFDGPTSITSDNLGVFVRFTTTGTLPGGLETETDYFLKNTTGSLYKAYKVATNADRDNLDGAAPNETIFPAQGFLQNNLEIDITSQGTGTHTLVTRGDLLSQWIDKINGFPISSQDTSDRNAFLEELRDENGKYINLQTLINNPETAQDDRGRAWVMGDTASYTAIKDVVAGKKTLIQGFYGKFTFYNLEGEARDVVDCSTGVDTSTERITLDNGISKVPTGAKCILKPNAGSTLPAGTSAGTTYYLNKISDTVYELYDSAANAIAGGSTGRINLTDTGSGIFTVIFTEYCNDRNNWMFLFEQRYPDDSTENFVVGMGSGVGYNAGIYLLSSSGQVTTSGSNNGLFADLNTWPDYTEVRLFMAEDASIVKSDSNPLESGTYYIGGGTGTCNRGLYTNLSDAQADGAANRNLADSSTVIKFNGSAGVGECKIMATSVREQFVAVNNTNQTFTDFPFLPFEEEAFFCWVLRANDPAATYQEVDYYLNGTLLYTHDTGITKADMPASDDMAANIGIWFNSTVPHVSLNARVRSVVWGASNEQLDADDIAPLNTYLGNKSWGTPAAVTLNDLTLSSDTIVEGSAEDTPVGTIEGRSTGSTLSLTDDAGDRFKLSGTTVLAGPTATDYGTATNHDITIRETLASAPNSPKDTIINITVTEVTAPAAFESGDWSVADKGTGGTVTVTVTALPDDGGSTITDIEYRVDSGSWTSSGLSTTGTFDIGSLTDDVEVDIELRAVNAVGNGAASDTKSVTPTTSTATEPDDIADLLAWHDFSDTATITHVAGAVSQVNDKSGNGLHLTQGSAGAKPTTGATTVNSLNVLDFDGGDTLIMPSGLRSVGNAACTVILVYKTSNTSQTASPWFITNGGLNFGNWRQVIQLEGAFDNMRFNQNSSVNVSGMTVGANNNTDVHIMGFRFDGANTLSKFFDGATVTDTDTTDIAVTGTVDSGLLGYLYTGSLVEAVAYSASISTSDLNALGASLADKWGGTWTDLS